jgi:hypothetical protein
MISALRSVSRRQAFFTTANASGRISLSFAGQFRLVLNLRESRLPIGGFLAQFVVGKLLQSGLDLIDPADERPKFLQFAVVLRPENPFQKIHSKPK